MDDETRELVEAAAEVYTYSAALYDQIANEPIGTMIHAAVPSGLFDKVKAAHTRYLKAIQSKEAAK